VWETFNILRPYAGLLTGYPGIVKANANLFFTLHCRPNPLCRYAVGGQADCLFSDFLQSRQDWKDDEEN
jgi:hypothetical protein